MASLGNLGVQHEQIDLDFEYFGTTIRVNPEYGPLDAVDFIEAADSLDVGSVSAMTLLKQFIREAIHQDDFETFWSLAKKHRQRKDDVMGVVFLIIESVGGRPTRRSADSSGGPSTTPSSTSTSSEEVIGRLEGQGRPDLALLVRRTA